MTTPESLYAQAALLASDPRIAASLSSMKQLSAGWAEAVSPAPVHKLLAAKLPVTDGRKHHEALFLQLVKAGADDGKLTIGHARLWQFLSLRFYPSNPSGLLQFQLELSVILEELARQSTESAKLLLKLV